MALQCGIVGLPNVGKSTLFNCLSNAKAQAANFPFCTIEPNVGVITVPDDRLNKLAELVDPDRIVPTTVEIVDIAGLVKGASKGEGLGNKFLANIRETDAILHVLRCFDDENVTHVDGSVDPVRDKEIIDTELQLKDLETIESRIQKVQKQAQTGGDKVAKQTYEVLVRYREALLQGKSARTVQFETKDEQKIAHELFLLTSKPVMYVCNVDEASAVSGNKYVEQVREAVKEEGAEILIVAAKTEADIAELETYEDRQMFLQEVGLEESGVSRLIRAAYKLLNLETYFTAGKMEVRAWTFHKGWKAPQVPVSSTRISKRDLSARRSSSTTTLSITARKLPYVRPESSTWKARNTWWKTATSCTSVSTCNQLFFKHGLARSVLVFLYNFFHHELSHHRNGRCRRMHRRLSGTGRQGRDLHCPRKAPGSYPPTGAAPEVRPEGGAFPPRKGMHRRRIPGKGGCHPGVRERLFH